MLICIVFYRTPLKNHTFIPTISPVPSSNTISTLTPSVNGYLPSPRPSISSTELNLGPSHIPSRHGTSSPSSVPLESPTPIPSSHFSNVSSNYPTFEPSVDISVDPSTNPSFYHISSPTDKPTRYSSSIPSMDPSLYPSLTMSNYPSNYPSGHPSNHPSGHPSNHPSRNPSDYPSSNPSNYPSSNPSNYPSSNPSNYPSTNPSNYPSTNPSNYPSTNPSDYPSNNPSDYPTNYPNNRPSFQPTQYPASQPSIIPTFSHEPTATPSEIPPCGMATDTRAAMISNIIQSVSDIQLISNLSTPQGRAFDWLVNKDEATLCPDAIKLIQRYVLAVIYYSTGGDAWFKCSASSNASDECGNEAPFFNKSRFLSSENECSWAGIRCSDTLCVTQIEFGTLISFFPSL